MQEEYEDAEQYLSLIRESDIALEKLIKYFSNVDNPVLLCVFGDHQPILNDSFMDELQNTSTDTEMMKLIKRYQTPYFIFTNYEIEKKDIEQISANYLNLLVMEAADLELNSYQTYLMRLFEDYPVVNMHEVMNSEGDWFTWDEAMNFHEIKEYEIVQYYNMFEK